MAEACYCAGDVLLFGEHRAGLFLHRLTGMYSQLHTFPFFKNLYSCCLHLLSMNSIYGKISLCNGEALSIVRDNNRLK